jgi:hypothetical protein
MHVFSAFWKSCPVAVDKGMDLLKIILFIPGDLAIIFPESVREVVPEKRCWFSIGA